MNPFVIRLAGMRQGAAAAVAVALLVECLQMFFNLPEQRAIRALVVALLSAVSVIWAVEEYVRGNKAFAALGFLLCAFLAPTAVYVFPRVGA